MSRGVVRRLFIGGDGQRVSGKELVIGGDFATSPLSASQNSLLNGWSWFAGAGGSVTWSSPSQNVTLSATGVDTGVDILLPTVPGRTYTIAYTLSGITGGNHSVLAGPTRGSTALLNAAVSTNGAKTTTFTATTRNTWVRMQKTNFASTIDNVSIH